MKKSANFVNNLSKTITNNQFNDNFDFINQNYHNLFNQDMNTHFEDYVKVKYLKGKR